MPQSLRETHVGFDDQVDVGLGCGADGTHVHDGVERLTRSQQQIIELRRVNEFSKLAGLQVLPFVIAAEAVAYGYSAPCIVEGGHEV